MNETNVRELLQAMKVAELKRESHERGLTLEKNGKKFTKAQLIEQIVQYDLEHCKTMEEKKEMQTERNHVKGMSLEDLKNFKVEEPEQQEVEFEETEAENKEVKTEKKPYVPARTLEEIVEKYGKEKPDFVYNDILKVGSFVVFVQTVEAKNGNFYDKLRKAKVIAVNRNKKLVKVETAMKSILIVPFEALLCIAEDEKAKIPKDVNDYLYQQRRDNREFKQKHGTRTHNTRWENFRSRNTEESEDDEAWGDGEETF